MCGRSSTPPPKPTAQRGGFCKLVYLHLNINAVPISTNICAFSKIRDFENRRYPISSRIWQFKYWNQYVENLNTNQSQYDHNWVLQDMPAEAAEKARYRPVRCHPQWLLHSLDGSIASEAKDWRPISALGTSHSTPTLWGTGCSRFVVSLCLLFGMGQ